MSVINSEVALQRAWEQIVVSLPEEDPRAIEACNQQWRSSWRRTGIWKFLKDADRNPERQNGDVLTYVIFGFDWPLLFNVLVGAKQ